MRTRASSAPARSSNPTLRPWATALKAPTTHGPVWLKAAGPGTAFEVGLYGLLHPAAPDCVLAPIASAPARGWILLPDGGQPLGERVTGDDLVDALVTVLPRYGRLQRELAPQVGEMLALGLGDMRPASMPQPVRRGARRGGAVRRAPWRRGGPSDLCAAGTLRDSFAGWCERLADAPVPASLDHNDLHPWNILVARGDTVADAHFYDWGDSVVAHPFASLLLPLGWVQRQLGFGRGAPEVLRVRDAYLDVFSDLAPHAELVEALELACHVGKAARALTWERALRALGDAEAGEHASAPLQTLHTLLEDDYLGGA